MSFEEERLEMRITVSEGIKRLPVYLLVDRSGSMKGAPIEAVKQGLELFKREVENDAQARETTYVGLIAFGGTAEDLTQGLVPVDQLQIPQLIATGSTPLGAALDLLNQAIDRDVREPIKGQSKGDWRPLVFILTDGRPTDEWREPRRRILERVRKKVLNVITVGCGPFIDEETLREIAIGPTFRMDSSTASFIEFFKWISQTTVSLSRPLSQLRGGEVQPLELPPPPPVLQYIPEVLSKK